MPGLLIADDTPIMRASLAGVVARERPWLAPLAEAGSGDQAVEVARAMRPDVVLIDIGMPSGDSSASALIRAEHPAAGLVILGAHADLGYARQAMRLGAADYLLKPVHPAQLLAALDYLQTQPCLAPQPASPGELTPLARALAYMQRELHRSDLRLPQVAAAALVSPSHLAALIRRRLGRSYLGHLTHLRVERAKLLLRTTTMTVAAVAAAVGYETPAPFYHHFKRTVGHTPHAFRQQAV